MDEQTQAALSPRDVIDRHMAEEIQVLVDRWHFESFNSTRLGHDTELWNMVLAAAQDLKSRLTAYIEEL